MAHIRFHLSREVRVSCQSCDWRGEYGEAIATIQDFEGKVEPGGIVPAAACPKCFSNCHIDAPLNAEPPKSPSDMLVETLARMSSYEDRGDIDDAFDTLNRVIARAKEIKGDLEDDTVKIVDHDFAEVGEALPAPETMTDTQINAELMGHALDRLAEIAKPKVEGPRVWLVQAWHWENPAVRQAIAATVERANEIAAGFVCDMLAEIEIGVKVAVPQNWGEPLRFVQNEVGEDADVEITPMVLEGAEPIVNLVGPGGWMLP